MRILAVAPYYEPEGGGLERYAHAILSRLARRGHKVRALAFTREAYGDGALDGVDIRRLAPRAVLSNTPLDPSFHGTVRGALRAWRPDLLVAHTPVPFPAEMATLAARRERVPYLVTYHAGRLEGGSPLLDGLAALDRWTLERAMLHRAARLIAVSPYVRDHALRAQRGKVAVVPPGVDAKRFRPGPAPQRPTVLFVGPLDRAYRWKGVDVLWEAFKRVRDAVPDARLLLVGEGDRFREFQLRRRADRLEGSVLLEGRLSPEGLLRAYQEASVAALPSTSPAESFGMVLAEANACGRPVVGSYVGGIPDFVQHGENGLLAEPGDPRSLADALVAILEDRALAERLGREGRRRVLEHHDWDRLTAATEQVYFEAAGKSRLERVGLPRPRVARMPPA